MKRGLTLIDALHYFCAVTDWHVTYKKKIDSFTVKANFLQLLDWVNEREKKERGEACIKHDMIIKLMRGALFHH